MALSVSGEMLACRVVEFSCPYETQLVPVPKNLKPQEILVKIVVSSFCHTDEMVRNGIFRTRLPCTGSHEGAGIVAAVGTAVTDYPPGTRVLCSPLNELCGKCSDCLAPEGYRQYCSYQGEAPGITRDGMFAEYVTADSRTATKLPDSVSFENAAPLACAGCTIWRGLKQAQLQPGQWLALVGSGGGGGVGHIGIKFAKAMGLNVIGIDVRDQALSLSRRSGADVVLNARQNEQTIVAEVRRVTNDRGVDAAINLSDAPNSATLACAITKKHSIMVQISQPENVSVAFHHIIFRDIKIHGSLLCTPNEIQEMIEFVAKHEIFVETVPFYGLGEVPRLMEMAHSGKLIGKAVLYVDL